VLEISYLLWQIKSDIAKRLFHFSEAICLVVKHLFQTERKRPINDRALIALVLIGDINQFPCDDLNVLESDGADFRIRNCLQVSVELRGL
jgi:hypothetical protein